MSCQWCQQDTLKEINGTYNRDDDVGASQVETGDADTGDDQDAMSLSAAGGELGNGSRASLRRHQAVQLQMLDAVEVQDLITNDAEMSEQVKNTDNHLPKSVSDYWRGRRRKDGQPVG